MAARGCTPRPSCGIVRPSRKSLLSARYSAALSCLFFAYFNHIFQSHFSLVGLTARRSEEHTSELQSQSNVVCRLLLEKKIRFQTALASIKLIQASAVLDLTEDDFDFLTSNKVWIATDRSRARRCVEACVYGTLDFVGYPRFPAPVEFIAAVIAYYVFF